MPYLETPAELADDLANKLGIYGAHDDEICTDKRPCRVCFIAAMSERIRDAVKNEKLLIPWNSSEG